MSHEFRVPEEEVTAMRKLIQEAFTTEPMRKLLELLSNHKELELMGVKTDGARPVALFTLDVHPERIQEKIPRPPLDESTCFH